MNRDPNAKPEIARLLDIMARLRDPDGGCPWDLEQSFATIAPYTIEEAYEVADAIERGDMGHLRDELGDLLLQVVFHAQMAREAGHFAFEDVARSISDKMIRRHPHVFGSETIPTADAQTLAWEDQKARERSDSAERSGRAPSVLDDVTPGLPALARALKLQKRAARVGFDWHADADVLDKVSEEVAELKSELDSEDTERIADELGDLLFSVVNLARRLSTDPEEALRHASNKFERRFRKLEHLAQEKGQTVETMSLAALDDLWRQVKTGGG